MILSSSSSGTPRSLSATSFDLADRLQTPVFVMLELDIGMNERLCDPLEWDDSRRFDRGKVMTHEMLERGDEFGRYLDVDVDGKRVYSKHETGRHANDHEVLELFTSAFADDVTRYGDGPQH